MQSHAPGEIKSSRAWGASKVHITALVLLLKCVNNSKHAHQAKSSLLQEEFPTPKFYWARKQTLRHLNKPWATREDGAWKETLNLMLLKHKHEFPPPSRQHIVLVPLTPFFHANPSQHKAPAPNGFPALTQHCCTYNYCRIHYRQNS